MSTTIDERVVEMRFDNENFEKNVSQSMSTLDKLKNALSFTALGKTSDAIDETTKSFGPSGLSGAVDTVTMKFDALQVMGMTALANITNSAVNAGAQLVKSFTIDPIAAGWGKFSELTLSKATLEAQGYTQEEIDSAIGLISTYADETSYHISEMTGAIGKMTATGIDLDKAAQIAMGVSNMVALGGQNAAVADRIYTQLAQAMGTGAMKRQDWMSFQNAQLDTKEFREQALDAAVTTKKLKKVGDGLYQIGNKVYDAGYLFGEGLTKLGWFDKSTMETVFTNYNSAFNDIYAYMNANGGTFSEAIDEISLAYENAGNEAGLFAIKALLAAQQARTFEDFTGSISEAVSTQWANIFQAFFGNTQQAIKLWTGLSNTMWTVFAGPLSKIVDILKIFSDEEEFGGTYYFVEALLHVGEAMEAVTEAMMDGFWSLFDDETVAAHLLDLVRGFERFTKSLIPTEKRVDQISRTFAGFGAIVDTVAYTIRTFAFFFTRELNPEAGSFGDLIWDATANLGDFLVKINEGIKESPVFLKTIKIIASNVARVVEILRGLFYGFDLETLISTFKSYGGGLAGVFGVASDQADVLVDALKKIVSSITGKDFPKFWEKVKKGIDWVRTSAVPVLKEWYSVFDEKVVQPIKKWIADGGLIDFLQKVKSYSQTVFNYLKERAPGVIQTVLTKLQEFTDWINKKIPQDKLKWLHDILTKFSDALGGFKSKFDPVKEGIETISGAVSTATDEKKTGWQKFVGFLTDAWDKIKEIGGKIKEQAQPLYDWFKSFAEDIDWGRFATMAIVLGLAIEAMKLYFEHSAKANLVNDIQTLKDLGDSLSGLMDAKAEKYMGDAILEIGIAIGILAASLAKIAELPADQLERAAKAIGVLMGVMGLMVGAFDDYLDGSVFQGGLWSDLLGGGTKGPEKVVTSLTTTVQSVSQSKQELKEAPSLVKKMFAMVEIAGALWIVADAMNKLNDFTPRQIVDSMTVVTTLLGELGFMVVAIDKWGSSNDISSAGATILAISVAVGVLSLVIDLVADIYKEHGENADKAVKTVSSLVIKLGAVAAGLEMFSKGASPGAILATAPVMLAVSIAIQMLVPVVAAFAKIAKSMKNPAEILYVTGSVSVMIGLLGGVAKGLERMSKDANAGSVLASAAVIAAIGIAMLELSKGVAIMVGAFALAGSEAAWMAIGESVAILIGIGAIAILLEKLSKEANATAIAASAAVILAIGVAFEAMSVGVAIMVLAFNSSNPDTINNVISTSLWMFIGLGAIAAVLEKLSAGSDSAAILASAVVLLAIGVAFEAMSVGVAIMTATFAHSDSEAIGLAITSSIILLAGLAGIAALLEGLSASANPASMLAASAAIIGMSIAFGAMAIAVAALGAATKLVGKGNIAVAAGILIGLLISAAAALYILAQAGPVAIIAAAAILVVAVSLGVIAASFVIFIAALSMLPEVIERFSSIGWEKLLDGLSKMAVAIVALTVTFAVLTAGAAAMALFAVSILAIVAALGLFGGVIALIGAGLAALSTAILTFAAMDSLVIAKFGETMARILAELVSLVPMLMALIESVILGILQIIIDSIPKVKEVLIALLDAVLELLRVEIPNYFETLLSVLEDCLDILDNHLEGIVERTISIFFNFIASIISGLAESIPEFVDRVMKSMVGFFNGMTIAIRNNTQNLKASYERCVMAIVDLIIAFFESQKDLFEEIARKLLGDDFVDGVKKAYETIQNIPGMVVGWIVEKFNSLEIVQKIKDAAHNLFNQFSTGLTDKDGFDSHSPSRKMEEVGENAAEGFLEGLASWWTELNTKGGEFAKNFANGLRDFGDEYSDAAGDAVESFTHALNGDAKLNEMAAAGRAATKAASDAASSQAKDTGTDSFYNAGQFAGQGFIDGLNSKKWAIRGAGISAGNSAIGGFTHSLEENSPSKVTFQSGEYFGQGFINGLLSYEKKMSTSASDTAENSVGSFNKALSEELGLDIDLNPVIRPILDLSEIQNGATLLQDLLSGASSLSYGGRLALADGVDIGGSAFSDELIGAVRDLKKTVDEFMDNPKTEINNQFDIHGETDPVVVADAVAARIQQQVDIKESRWA